MIALLPEVTLNEAAQNAIVAWNGKEEVLMLTTDLSSSSNVNVLEILPLPSNPKKIEEASMDSFKKFIKIFNERAKSAGAMTGERTLGLGPTGEGYRGIVITFSANLGAHNITVVEVNVQDDFIRWAENFTAGMGVKINVSIEMNYTIGKILRSGIKYFVFDIVSLTQEKKTINPILYRFDTEYLYYPIEITSISLPKNNEPTELNIFLITKGQVDDTTPIKRCRFERGAGFYQYVIFTKEELKKVSKEIADLFGSYAFAAHIFWKGTQADMKYELTNDLKIYAQNIETPPTENEIYRHLFWENYKASVKKLFGNSFIGFVLLCIAEPSFLPLVGVVIFGIVSSPFLASKFLRITKLVENKFIAYGVCAGVLLLVLFIPIPEYWFFTFETFCLLALFFFICAVTAIVLLIIKILKKL